MVGALRPWVPFYNIKPRILPSSSPPTTLAQTTNTSAIGELVIQVLVPVSTYPPSTFLARVSMLPGSEPWLGSVSPKQPTHSPEASLGRYFFFCSSVPNSLMGTITSEDCTLIIER